jgi:hypothetical protein
MVTAKGRRITSTRPHASAALLLQHMHKTGRMCYTVGSVLAQPDNKVVQYTLPHCYCKLRKRCNADINLGGQCFSLATQLASAYLLSNSSAMSHCCSARQRCCGRSAYSTAAKAAWTSGFPRMLTCRRHGHFAFREVLETRMPQALQLKSS